MKYFYIALMMASACSATPKQTIDLGVSYYDTSLDGELVKDSWGDDHSVYLETKRTKPKKAASK